MARPLPIGAVAVEPLSAKVVGNHALLVANLGKKQCLDNWSSASLESLGFLWMASWAFVLVLG